MTLLDRQRGCLIGMAVGDALGAAVEFKAPGSFDPVKGYRDGGPHALAPGQWTDDTSMALALADSIGQAGWDLADQLTRYCRWYREGKYSVNGRCFDIGITCSGALRRFEEHGDPARSASRDESSSGNGSIMRLAPVPIRYVELYWFRNFNLLAERGCESSLTTHGSPQCLSACRWMTVALAALMWGESRENVLSPDWPVTAVLRRQAPFHPEIDAILAGSFARRSPPEIRGGGYVVHSLEAALWAFSRAESFEQAVLDAVNLGDDADTTGAVCGQFAGAYWGESGMPPALREGLDRRDMLESALAALV